MVGPCRQASATCAAISPSCSSSTVAGEVPLVMHSTRFLYLSFFTNWITAYMPKHSESMRSAESAEASCLLALSMAAIVRNETGAILCSSVMCSYVPSPCSVASVLAVSAVPCSMMPTASRDAKRTLVLTRPSIAGTASGSSAASMTIATASLSPMLIIEAVTVFPLGLPAALKKNRRGARGL